MIRRTPLLVLVAIVAGIGVAQGAPATRATLTFGNQAPVLCIDTALRKAFVPNYAGGTLSVVDLATPTVAATVPVAPSPRRLTCNEATHRVYVVHATTPATMTVIDARTHAAVATVAVGNDARNVGSNFLIDEAYVSNFGSGTVSIVSTATNTVVATLPVGTNPQAPASNDRLKKT